MKVFKCVIKKRTQIQNEKQNKKAIDHALTLYINN